MTTIKKLAAILLALVLVAGMLTACTATAPAAPAPAPAEDAPVASGVEIKQYKIGLAHYTDSGKGVDAIKAYIAGISDTVGCEFEIATLSTYDEATNLTVIQNLISAGCNGIIMSADMGTAAIVEECASAGVYLAGFLCDYNASMYTTYDAVFKSPYFLGTVCDGSADQSGYGVAVAEKVIADGYKNIGVIIFPSFAYPNQAQVAAVFKEKIDEYNATAADADKITVADPVELMFAPLEPTYLSEHPDLDCIFSVAAGAGFVYPILVANNKTNIKLFTTGFEGTDDVDNFGTSGNQCYQGTLFSSPEAIAYPLCLLIDKLNGASYPDQPEVAERVDCSSLMVLSDEDMAKVVAHSIYFTANYADALITGEDIIKLCASYNPEATYAGLVDAVNHLAVDDLK